MICANCQTSLPDEAVACWKCGTPLAGTAKDAPGKPSEPDVLLALLTFFAALIFFACAGWSIPFAIWGNLSTAAKDSPQWSSLLGIVSGLAFIVATVACLGGAWWGSYWLIKRILRPG